MVRRFPKPVPRITLTSPPEEDLFFDGPERDISTSGIGEVQEPSDDDEEEVEFPVPLIEMDYQASSCHSVNYQPFAPEGRETNDNVIVNSTENEALQALLPYCPHVLTYPDSKCPLGEECSMQQICHSNSHSNGCSREPCKYSHDQVATCRRLFKYGHCSRQNCRYSHDQELRNTIRESIADHVDHRIFGVKDQFSVATQAGFGSRCRRTHRHSGRGLER
jgi:hypothetical protein